MHTLQTVHHAVPFLAEIHVLAVQDMRVQAFKCNPDAFTASTQALSAQPDAAVQTCPITTSPAARGNGAATSNGWLSRTAALVEGTKPRSGPATVPAVSTAASDSTALPTSIFHSPKHNSTDRQSQPACSSKTDANGDVCDGHVAPEGGVLVGSSDMADSHCGVVIALALCGDYVCSAAGDAMIKVWKAGSLEFVRSV